MDISNLGAGRLANERSEAARSRTALPYKVCVVREGCWLWLKPRYGTEAPYQCYYSLREAFICV